MLNKISSYIGFAIRKGSVVYGIDNITAVRKRQYLIIACSSSENTLKKTRAYCEKHNHPLMITTMPLNQLVHKDNCMVIAITDKQLAAAIAAHADNINFILSEEIALD